MRLLKVEKYSTTSSMQILSQKYVHDKDAFFKLTKLTLEWKSPLAESNQVFQPSPAEIFITYQGAITLHSPK